MAIDIFSRPYTLENRQSGERLNLGVFKGNLSLCVFTKSGGGKPTFRAAITPFILEALRTALLQAKKGSPDTKLPLQKSKFNEQSNKWDLEWVITIAKDSKMIYHITVTDCMNGNQTWDFALKGTGGISIGADPMSPADRSGIAFSVLISWLEMARMACLMTDEKYDPKNGGGNRGGGNYNRGGNGGGGYNNNNQKSAPPASGASDMDDDIPF